MHALEAVRTPIEEGLSIELVISLGPLIQLLWPFFPRLESAQRSYFSGSNRESAGRQCLR